MAVVESEFGEWPLKRLMTEVVGTGTKSAEDMTREQASEAMRRILAGEPDHTTLGAFWLANRWKHNNAEELAAYADVVAEESVETLRRKLTLSTAGPTTTAKAGPRFSASAQVSSPPPPGRPSSSTPATASRRRSRTPTSTCSTNSASAPNSTRGVADMVDDTGFGFYYQPRFNPAIHALWERRDNMGVRTFVNTIETIANPANASVHLGSFYHLAFAKKMVNTFEAASTTTSTASSCSRGWRATTTSAPARQCRRVARPARSPTTRTSRLRHPHRRVRDGH